MKKISVFVILFLVIISLVLLVFAQDQSQENAGQSYLQQEWNKILEQNSFGRFILGVNVFFEALSPLFKIIIGIEYSLSWMFFLSLISWLVVFIIIFYAARLIFVDRLWICFFISLIILIIAAQTKIFPTSVSFFTPLFTNLEIIILSLFIIIVLLLFYIYFMSRFHKTLEQQDEKEREKIREEKAEVVEKIHDIEMKAAGFKPVGTSGKHWKKTYK